MNGCWGDKNRTEWRGKELEDRDTERRVERVVEDRGQEEGDRGQKCGQGMEDKGQNEENAKASQSLKLIKIKEQRKSENGM